MMYKYQDKIKYFERILSNYIFSYKLMSFKNFKMVSPATYIYQTLKEDKYNILTKIIYDSAILFYALAPKDFKKNSESVYRRRTDNTMANRKSTIGKTTIYKTYT